MTTMPKNEATDERRRQILEQAARIFAANGYRQTDVQEIADSVGVGKGTIYRYFDTKENLFLKTVDHGMQQLRDTLQGARQAFRDPLDGMTAALRAFLAFFDAHPEFVELFIQERAEFKDRKKPTYLEYRETDSRSWQEALQRLIADGRARPVSPQRVLDMVGDLLYGLIFTNVFLSADRSLADQAEDIIDIVLYGILADGERTQRKG